MLITKRANRKGAVGRARYLRKNSTPSEERIWSYVRASKLGYRFRRQHPVGAYILDIFCPALKFAIEVDGEQFHSESETQVRDAYLAERGIAVHHIKLQDVNDWDAIYVEMVEAIKRRAEFVEAWLKRRHNSNST